ncbi:MAG: hypothetical protein JJT78_07895, partial [Leptospira sp.]|nr:hypothetical protein [Leptospira sp.]
MSNNQFYINERIVELEKKLKQSMNEKDLLELLNELGKTGGNRSSDLEADSKSIDKERMNLNE